ncbi:hypothetical protein [Acinetobacter pittii]|uniref:hypothetical protein n=1 Tax=Acinetobacter pittii TaxID=48296 RepID=UPI001D084706|nr:hypothetical protein [Acinetobacter pittii]
MDNYKEYLNPKDHYLFVKWPLSKPVDPDWIEIPEGAELYVYWHGNDTYNFQVEKSYFENGSWQPCAWTVEEIKSDKAGAKILWQRHTQDPALISGAEALADITNVQHAYDDRDVWYTTQYSTLTIPEILKGETSDGRELNFRLKPQTIKLELEMPKPFEPKEGDEYFYISTLQHCLYSHDVWSDEPADITQTAFGAYRTEEDVKKAVEQLRKIRGTNS